MVTCFFRNKHCPYSTHPPSSRRHGHNLKLHCTFAVLFCYKSFIDIPRAVANSKIISGQPINTLHVSTDISSSALYNILAYVLKEYVMTLYKNYQLTHPNALVCISFNGVLFRPLNIVCSLLLLWFLIFFIFSFGDIRQYGWYRVLAGDVYGTGLWWIRMAKFLCSCLRQPSKAIDRSIYMYREKWLLWIVRNGWLSSSGRGQVIRRDIASSYVPKSDLFGTVYQGGKYHINNVK